MARTRNPTVLTRTVTPGKQGTRMREDRYQRYRDAILELVPEGDGIPLRDLSSALAERLAGLSEDERGKVTWNMMTVKLDLEARGLIERVPGARPQRLRRTT